MPPALLSRSLDPLLGLFSGVLAYHLYESHPRNAIPDDDKLIPLLRWKWNTFQQHRQAALTDLDLKAK